MEVVVIGGGAAGLFTAIMIKTKAKTKVNVTIIERLEKVGKKILATGNGRCNLSNLNVVDKKYNNPQFARNILKQFDVKATLAFFEEIGLLTKSDEEGRVYPYSEMANSVLNVLRSEIKRLGIIEKVNFDVRTINRVNDTFIIESKNRLQQEADYIVFATGGKSMPVLGSNGSGFDLLKRFKLKITNLTQGLTGIKVDDAQIKGLNGIRMKSLVRLYHKRQKKIVWFEAGEVQFKENGLSGVVIMQMQSHIARNYQIKEVICSLDLLPEYKEEQVVELLTSRIKHMEIDENESIFTGIFPRMMALQILKRSKIDLAGYTNTLLKKDIKKMAVEIKNFTFDIKGFYDYDRSQVTVGGLDLNEVLPDTLETRKVPNLYVCGEVLDIDGESGGYNLQWAWSSAYVVANAITKRVKDNI